MPGVRGRKWWGASRRARVCAASGAIAIVVLGAQLPRPRGGSGMPALRDPRTTAALPGAHTKTTATPCADLDRSHLRSAPAERVASGARPAKQDARVRPTRAHHRRRACASVDRSCDGRTHTRATKSVPACACTTIAASHPSDRRRTRCGTTSSATCTSVRVASPSAARASTTHSSATTRTRCQSRCCRCVRAAKAGTRGAGLDCARTHAPGSVLHRVVLRPNRHA